MKIEYSGPKPIISQHGISFKEGKEDKYIYLKHSLQILKAISHEYNKNQNYSYYIKTDDLSQDEMTDMVLKYHPDIQSVLNMEVTTYNQYLLTEENDVKDNHILTDDEKKIFLNNLKIMEKYKIQRMKNKFFYKHVIQTIKEQIFEHKIKQLTTPFNEKFWHIFQTLQGELSSYKNSVESEIKVKDEEYLSITLFVKNL
ncbi:MAG: hypothetical protein HRT43_09270 [Campylobacteraceae bacterium]|nr:hypothetical protein [Campylobacteraceae bacterium]